MKRVLIITNLLPNKTIEYKKDENDILLVTEDNIKKYHDDIEFKYLFTVPDTNKHLAKITSRWKTYYSLKKSAEFKLGDRVITVLPIIQFRRRFFFRKILYDFSFWLNRSKIDSIVKEFSPTIIHAHRIDVDGYFAQKISDKYNIPYVVTLRKSKRYDIDWLDKKVMLSAKELIALSPTIKKQIKMSVEYPISMIPHGIDDTVFKPKQTKQIIEPIKLVTIARLLDWKNIDILINAFSQINKNYILHIYGKGPEHEKLNELISNFNLEDRIKLKGIVPHEEIPETLRKYDIFILLSFPETFGRVYIEAMSCGLPVIASKGTGMDGIITNDEEGFLIDYKETKSILNRLNYLIDNPEVIIGLREKAIKLSTRFTWKTVAKELHDVYDNV